jgi:hypothetical protein
MLNYMSNNPKQYNEILLFIIIFLLITIGIIVYFMSSTTDDVKKELSTLEMACPECPKCPDLTCNEGKCPDCVCEDSKLNCPSVDDIVSGIFPGRNTGITQGGEYFNVMGNEDYQLISGLSVYDSVSAFPQDSILDQSISNYNNNNNSSNINSDINTQFSKSLNPQTNNPSPSVNMDTERMQDSERNSVSSTTNNSNNLSVTNDKSPPSSEP